MHLPELCCRAAVVADAVAARLADASLAGPLPCRLPRLNT